MILVTGATGTTGSEVVRELRKADVPFRAMVRDVERAAAVLGDDVDLVHGDLVDPGSLGLATEGVDTLFLLTPPHEDTLTQNQNVIAAAKRAGVGHVVKLSAIGAAEGSPLQLGRWHAAVEQEVADSGMAYTVLRAGSFMQNFFNHIQTIREQSRVYSVGGDGPVTMVDTRDIAEVAATVLRAPSDHARQIYLLTGPEAITDAEATAEIARVLAREITHVEMSPDDARSAMGRMGMPTWLIDDLLLIDEFAKAGRLGTVSPHAEQLLGRPPRPFAEFASDHRAQFGG